MMAGVFDALQCLFPASNLYAEVWRGPPTDWKGLFRQSGHYDLQTSEGTATGDLSDHNRGRGIYAARLCRLISVGLVSGKVSEDACKSPESGRYHYSSSSTFFSHRYLQHADLRCRRTHDLPYHIYFFPVLNVSMDAFLFAYGRSFSYRPSLIQKVTAPSSVHSSSSGQSIAFDSESSENDNIMTVVLRAEVNPSKAILWSRISFSNE